MKYLLIITAVLLLTSCATEKRCNTKYPPKSSIEYIYIEKEVTRWKDTIIFKDLPPVIIERWVEVKDTLKLIGAYSKALSWVNGGILQGQLKEGLNPVKIEYKIKEVIVERTEYKDKEIIKEVRYYPKYLVWGAIIGLIAIVYLIFRIFV
jgi:hypothetical protein